MQVPCLQKKHIFLDQGFISRAAMEVRAPKNYEVTLNTEYIPSHQNIIKK